LLSSVKLSAFNASAAQWKIERIKESWGGGLAFGRLRFLLQEPTLKKKKTPFSGVSQ